METIFKRGIVELDHSWHRTQYYFKKTELSKYFQIFLGNFEISSSKTRIVVEKPGKKGKEATFKLLNRRPPSISHYSSYCAIIDFVT